MKTIYVLKLERNSLLKLIKYHPQIIKIKYHHNTCFLYVDENNYQKLLKYFNIYNITLVKVTGLQKYKLLVKKYNIFIISNILGIMFLYLLSRMIFDIKIMTDKEDLIKIISNELDSYKLSKYYLTKSYNEKEQIKNKILNDYKDKIEWLEIDQKGNRYYVYVLERIINKQSEFKKQHVIAKRNAIILEIKASSGQIVKKVNDYVNKGDIIISAFITKNDEVKDIIRADGKVYGETWYTVKVELPKLYNEIIYTGKNYSRISISLFGKKWFLFGKGKYSLEKVIDQKLFDHSLLPFTIYKSKIYEIKSNSVQYTYNKALEKGLLIAKEKLLDNLMKDSQILEEKKLKLYEENSKIKMEVFFKVYENITDYIEIEGE